MLGSLLVSGGEIQHSNLLLYSDSIFRQDGERMRYPILLPILMIPNKLCVAIESIAEPCST